MPGLDSSFPTAGAGGQRAACARRRLVRRTALRTSGVRRTTRECGTTGRGPRSPRTVRVTLTAPAGRRFAAGRAPEPAGGSAPAAMTSATALGSGFRAPVTSAGSPRCCGSAIGQPNEGRRRKGSRRPPWSGPPFRPSSGPPGRSVGDQSRMAAMNAPNEQATGAAHPAEAHGVPAGRRGATDRDTVDEATRAAAAGAQILDSGGGASPRATGLHCVSAISR